MGFLGDLSDSFGLLTDSLDLFGFLADLLGLGFLDFQWFGSFRFSVIWIFTFFCGFGFCWFSSDRIVLLSFADTKMEKNKAGMKLFRLRGGFARRKWKLRDERKSTARSVKA